VKRSNDGQEINAYGQLLQDLANSGGIHPSIIDILNKGFND